MFPIGKMNQRMLCRDIIVNYVNCKNPTNTNTLFGQNAKILLLNFIVYKLTIGFKRLINELLIWTLLFTFSSTINTLSVNLTSNHYIVPTYNFFTHNSNEQVSLSEHSFTIHNHSYIYVFTRPLTQFGSLPADKICIFI